jgi:hypothetical protein
VSLAAYDLLQSATSDEHTIVNDLRLYYFLVYYTPRRLHRQARHDKWPLLSVLTRLARTITLYFTVFIVRLDGCSANRRILIGCDRPQYNGHADFSGHGISCAT